MTLVMTIIAAVVLMALVVAGLAIGRLITGKNKLRKGCGMTPKGKKSCDVCGASKKCDEDDNDRDHPTSRDDSKQN